MTSLQDVAARAYGHMLEEAANLLGPSPAFFQLWPLDAGRPPWSVLSQGLYEHLGSFRVVHTHAEGGRWVLPDEAVYLDGAALRSVTAVFFPEGNAVCRQMCIPRPAWLCRFTAKVLDQGLCTVDRSSLRAASCSCRDEALVKALVAITLPVATGPAAVQRALLQRKHSQATLLSPGLLRDFIRAHMSETVAALKAHRGHFAALLSYCLQDLDDSDAASCSELCGMPTPSSRLL